ncbi:hypothetical protein RBWH47_05889 [Rhodopirellula baltica WH47]|uniref:Uncharacterized protein n=1 Tax=Rhodopirellula baltica WH47 TaxID=991778 RepID=F2AW65_RHOBT|nr:hypothetical protein RBWH47_05889 [Rhodopirellula baltica WH47]
MDETPDPHARNLPPTSSCVTNRAGNSGLMPSKSTI